MKNRGISPNELKCIHALLNQHGLIDDKASIVEAFSSGRTKSSKELTGNEAGALIAHLKTLDQNDTRATRMRNKILSMAHEMGWWKTEQALPASAVSKPKIDMMRVNNWCTKYGYLHKPIDDYNYSELPKLVSQFEGVYKDHLKQ